MVDVTVDVWGSFACFAQSEAKVERVTYSAPTPSACRGILSAIYCKPVEFYYQIKQIEVMNPIRRISIKRNEVMRKADKDHNPLYVDDVRTQRNAEYLKDVYYRISAQMIKRTDYEGPEGDAKFKTQFMKRVERGKCFYQPYLGTKECMCFFSAPDESMKPIQSSMDLGITLYDIFDIRDNTPLDTQQQTGRIFVTYYHPYMINGIINVPDYDSAEVFKPHE